MPSTSTVSITTSRSEAAAAGEALAFSTGASSIMVVPISSAARPSQKDQARAPSSPSGSGRSPGRPGMNRVRISTRLPSTARKAFSSRVWCTAISPVVP
ncbi:hypothetical protein [Pseudoroseomonas cervicalis]|uniref:hypothetical protein n=1 Tax=Teichococcus cervicalis TaxID=204525 RepID=UPI0027D91EAD|nr:hypothetical protein [Pseudoroseomonas cervicalis]